MRSLRRTLLLKNPALIPRSSCRSHERLAVLGMPSRRTYGATLLRAIWADGRWLEHSNFYRSWWGPLQLPVVPRRRPSINSFPRRR